MSFSGLLVRATVGVAILVAFALLAGVLGKRLPSSFVPDEDMGYFFLNVQLPDAASLQRTDAVCRKVERMLGETEGVRYYNTVAGFSLLSYISATYNGFYFVSLQPWARARARRGWTPRALVTRLNKRFRAEIPEANVFAFMPPGIPGLGTAAASRSGCRTAAAAPSRT